RGEATIFIRTLTGKTISIPEISIERLTVDTMKQIIAGKVGMEPGEMRLIFGSKQIEDGRTLGEDYGVGNGSTLHLVQRLEGGVGMASK
ncbi:polyubiquitin containing 7 ubiquitin monomers, partial [Aspergillus phoenicis ATCC 13157]